jgi:hypothetical protein
MATAAVSHVYAQSHTRTHQVFFQNPPLYLHVTSTTKSGLEKAVAKIEELMQQELPNLVDERRFRRREPEQFERDEFGRVCIFRFRPPQKSG